MTGILPGILFFYCLLIYVVVVAFDRFKMESLDLTNMRLPFSPGNGNTMLYPALHLN